MSNQTVTEVSCIALNAVQMTLEVMWGRRIFFKCYSQRARVEENRVIFESVRVAFVFDEPFSEREREAWGFEINNIEVTRDGPGSPWTLTRQNCTCWVADRTRYCVHFERDVRRHKSAYISFDDNGLNDDKKLWAVTGKSCTERRVYTEVPAP